MNTVIELHHWCYWYFGFDNECIVNENHSYSTTFFIPYSIIYCIYVLHITLQYFTQFFNRQRRCKYSDELPTVFCSFPLSETKKCYWRDFYAGGSTDFDKGVSTSRHSLSSIYILSTKIYSSRGSISHSSKPKTLTIWLSFVCPIQP